MVDGEPYSLEVAQFGIRVLVIVPGAHRTGFGSANVDKHVKPSEEDTGGHPRQHQTRADQKTISI